MEYRFGTVSIFMLPHQEQIEKMNMILSQHSKIILGRMGIPIPQGKINVICLIIYGNTDQLGSLTGKLGHLPGVQVKSCLYKTEKAMNK